MALHCGDSVWMAVGAAEAMYRSPWYDAVKKT
jgi:hypothetical protein